MSWRIRRHCHRNADLATRTNALPNRPVGTKSWSPDKSRSRYFTLFTKAGKKLCTSEKQLKIVSRIGKLINVHLVVPDVVLIVYCSIDVLVSDFLLSGKPNDEFDDEAF